MNSQYPNWQWTILPLFPIVCGDPFTCHCRWDWNVWYLKIKPLLLFQSWIKSTPTSNTEIYWSLLKCRGNSFLLAFFTSLRVKIKQQSRSGLTETPGRRQEMGLKNFLLLFWPPVHRWMPLVCDTCRNRCTAILWQVLLRLFLSLLIFTITVLLSFTDCRQEAEGKRGMFFSKRNETVT